MKKFLALSVLLVLLTGCAIPLPLKIATWALDGISYLASGKSVTDHGISLLAQQDCALWRTVKGEPICSDYGDDTGTVIAAVDSGPRIAPEGQAMLQEARVNAEASAKTAGREIPSAPDDITGVPGGEDAAWSNPGGETVGNGESLEQERGEDLFKVLPLEDLLDGLLPAASPTGSSETERAVALLPAEAAFGQDALPSVTPAATKPEPKPETRPKTEVAPAPPRKPAVGLAENGSARNDTARLTLASVPAPANRFLVIGSFAGKANARYLADQYNGLEPTVITADLDGRTRYRVVVGPFSRGEEKNIRRRLKRAGIYDSWPIDLKVAEWIEARRQPLHRETGDRQLAQVD